MPRGNGGLTPKGAQFSSLLFIIGIILAISVVMPHLAGDNSYPLDYDPFLAEARKHNVASIRVLANGQTLNVELKNPIAFPMRPRSIVGEIIQSKEDQEERFENVRQVLVNLPGRYDADLELKALVKEGKVRVSADPLPIPGSGGILGMLGGWLPMIIFIGIWVYFMRQMQGGGAGRAIPFGQARLRLAANKKEERITFADVAGCDEAKTEMREIVEFLKEPKKFQRLGAKIPKGVLLIGPPGAGKTLLAKAVAGEAEVPFFYLSGSDFVEMFVGVGASRVRDLFEQGKKKAPCIVFIDEIDAVGRHRGTGIGGGHDEREQTLNQLLVEMDGFEVNSGVIIMAASNRPDVLDPALLRPGRFDRQIVVDRPDVKGREEILKIHARKLPLDAAVNFRTIALQTPGFAGADLANLVNEAALLAARRGSEHETVTMDDFEKAKDKVLMGVERRSVVLSEQDKNVIAYHEAGHAIVAASLPAADPVHRVTIIPRGRALGLTQQLPEEDRYNYSKEYLLDRVATMLGGRIAEEIVFGEPKVTTGAGDDLERATDLVRNVVCKFGMSGLGYRTFGKRRDHEFLGRMIDQERDFSDATALEIDRETTKIFDEQARRVRTILAEKIEKLHALAAALKEHETLNGEAVGQILQ